MKCLSILCFAIPLLVFVPILRAQSENPIRQANVTFTTIDVPGAIATDVYGINTFGDMVGTFAPDASSNSGFIYSKGSFTTFDYPGGDTTFAMGINDSDLISGWAYVNQRTAGAGFLYDGTNFTTVNIPHQNTTVVNGINNAGVIVGGDGSLAATAGFELVGKRLQKVVPPGSFCSVLATGINNLGQVVGWTCGGLGNNNVFVMKNGKYRTIAVPGAIDLTEAWGINDQGVVVGWYETSSGFAGFALINGKYFSLNYPGATGTFAFGINDSGQIVGAYTLSNNMTHGFLTSPITAADFQ